MADADLCLCTKRRDQHPEGAAALKAMGALLLRDGVNVCLHGRFQLDRKATWAAERGPKPKRMALTLNGCGACGQKNLPLEKVKGQYRVSSHNCPGPAKEEAAAP